MDMAAQRAGGILGDYCRDSAPQQQAQLGTQQRGHDAIRIAAGAATGTKNGRKIGVSLRCSSVNEGAPSHPPPSLLLYSTL